VIMENERLDNLEKQIDLLIKKYLDLKKENSILKQKLKYKGEINNPKFDELQEFKSENDKLREKNGRAAKRLKALLEKLEIEAAGL